MMHKTVEIRTRKTIEKFAVGTPTASKATVPRFEDAAKGGGRWCYTPNGIPGATEHADTMCLPLPANRHTDDEDFISAKKLYGSGDLKPT